MENRTADGFVFFSLGTSASTRQIAAATKRAIVRAFGRLPALHFLLKTDADDREFVEAAAHTPNVHVLSWAPQRSLLAHPRCRLFVSHAGYNSVLEAVHSGVPMLLLPVFFDQHRNARTVEYRGLGRLLEPAEITADRLEFELRAVLTNER